MKVAFYTLGCKVNTYETEAIWQIFNDKGYERVSFDEQADIYIINTCSVTNKADSKSRKMIRKATRMNKNAVVAVMGCYSEHKYEEISKIEGVSVVIGTENKKQIVDLIEEYLQTKKQIVNVLKLTNKFENINALEFEHTRAFLKIQDGCENYCTFCIIPLLRGKLRSRDKLSTLEEARNIVKHGYKEIVLTGIHTGAYGVDLEDYSFEELISDLLEINGLERLRISSIEINQITDKILHTIKNNTKMAHHLHLPIQSGSNSVLKRMGRKYTLDEYIDKINYIRKIVPDIAITTDVIVGFPGETEEEFKETINTINQIKFSQLHVFPYSKRDNTRAARMINQVNEKIKNDRVDVLIKLSEKLNLEYANKFINKPLYYIPETKYDENKLIGHTSNYLKVIINGDENLIGKNLKIEILQPVYPNSIGKIIE